MNRDVIPTILTADDVCNISVEVLRYLPSISTDIVLRSVNNFIAANSNSTDDTHRQAALILNSVYSEVNSINEYLNSSDAKELADTLYRLNYDDITADVGLDTLKRYRAAILQLLSEDSSFVESYSTESLKLRNTGTMVAYTAKLDTNNFDTTLQLMREAARGDVIALSLCSRIQKNASLFKNGNRAVNKSTVMRKAIYKKDKLKSLLKSLDFLIPRLEAGQSPITWRRL